MAMERRKGLEWLEEVKTYLEENGRIRPRELRPARPFSMTGKTLEQMAKLL